MTSTDRWAELAAIAAVVASVAACYPLVGKAATAIKRKKQVKIQADVLAALGDWQRWSVDRPRTGAGAPLVGTEEIADSLSLPIDQVVHALEQLKSQGAVASGGATLSHPARWFIIRK